MRRAAPDRARPAGVRLRTGCTAERPGRRIGAHGTSRVARGVTGGGTAAQFDGMEETPHVFESRFRVRSYELDGFAHLNHAVFLNWFE